MEIPILGGGPKLSPIEQFSALLDTLCDTLAAAKVAADRTLPGSELAKSLGRANTLKAEISPVLAGVLAQVKAAEQKRNREKAIELILEMARSCEIDLESASFAPGEDDGGSNISRDSEVLREVAGQVSEALGGGPVIPAARA